ASGTDTLIASRPKSSSIGGPGRIGAPDAAMIAASGVDFPAPFGPVRRILSGPTISTGGARLSESSERTRLLRWTVVSGRARRTLDDDRSESLAASRSARAEASSAALSPRRFAADFSAKFASPFITILGRRLFSLSLAAFR